MIPLIMAAAQLGAGALAEYFAAQGRAKQEALLQQSLDEYGNLSIPKLQELAAQEIGPSAFEEIQTDPRLRDAQYAALAKMGELADSSGMTLEEQVALKKVQNQLARSEAAGRSSILQNMQARGVGGSGAELAMQLQNQQGSASRANEAGMDTAARAAQRRFDAIIQQGRMGGDIRGQEYNEKSRAAEARDAIARYNAGARTDVNRYNAGLPMQQYNAQAQRLQGMAALRGGMGQMAAQQGDRTANFINQSASLAGNTYDQYGTMQDRNALNTKMDARYEQDRQDRLRREAEDRKWREKYYGGTP